MNVSDGSLQMELDLENDSVRATLAEDFEAEQQRIQQFLRKLSAPLLVINNQGDVARQVKRHLGVTS